MHQSVRDYWITFNDPLEGRVNFMYLDQKGWVSTGIGNKIDATVKANTAPTSDERSKSLVMARELKWLTKTNDVATADQVAVDWDAVKAHLELAPQGHLAFKPFTFLHLDNSEIDRHVFVVLDRMETTRIGTGASSPFADFEEWPANAQLATMSMCWALGAAFKFPNFEGFVKGRNWTGAAEECHFTPDIGTIRIRNKLDRSHFLLAAAVEAGSLPPEKIAMDLSDVFGVQGALLDLGFRPGPQDGVDGPLTQRAVMAFQSANGLDVNGRFDDPDTVSALGDALTVGGFTVLGVP
ncbi:peptidoglycan-binding protein [Streptomyces sp. NPDC049555]|uniref:peptidoglycan-binding protein n=1 Tax=Streptomyces sp. NPDC049555 TaxID=3154930 RepID=UPI0034233547